MFTLYDRRGGINTAIDAHKQPKKSIKLPPFKKILRSQINYYRELRMEQTVVHYPEIFVKDWNLMNFVLLNVVKD